MRGLPGVMLVPTTTAWGVIDLMVSRVLTRGLWALSSNTFGYYRVRTAAPHHCTKRIKSGGVKDAEGRCRDILYILPSHILSSPS